MKRSLTLMVAVAVSLLVVGSAQTQEQGGQGTILRASLRGSNEVPAVSSTGLAEFVGQVSSDETTVNWVLSYRNLEGATIVQAHVHFGQKDVNGGVMVFFCGGGGKPACPAAPATIMGTWVAADVLGPAGQGIAAGEFAEALAAMRNGLSYANIHTDKHPGGEIRGQVRR